MAAIMDEDLRAWRSFATRAIGGSMKFDAMKVNLVIIGDSRVGKFALTQALSVSSLEVIKPDRRGWRIFRPTDSAVTYRLLSLKSAYRSFSKLLENDELNSGNAVGLVLVENEFSAAHSKMVELLRTHGISVCVIFTKADLVYSKLASGKLPGTLYSSLLSRTELVEVIHRNTDTIMPAGIRCFVISSIELYRASVDAKDRCQFEELFFLKWLRYRCERDMDTMPAGLGETPPAQSSGRWIGRSLFKRSRGGQSFGSERPTSYMYFQTKDPITNVAPCDLKTAVPNEYFSVPRNMADSLPELDDEEDMSYNRQRRGKLGVRPNDHYVRDRHRASDSAFGGSTPRTFSFGHLHHHRHPSGTFHTKAGSDNASVSRQRFTSDDEDSDR